MDLSVISLFLDNQASQKTKDTYKWALERWFAFLGDREPSVEVALEFKEHLGDTLAPRSAANVFNTCRVFYRWHGEFNPFERLKSPRKVVNATPVVPEDSLVEKMLELCDNERDKAIMLLLLNGLRASEVLNLETESVQWSEAFNCVIIKVIGKGNRERLVPVVDAVASSIAKWDDLARKKFPDRHWLFVRYDGRKMNVRAVEKVVEKWSGRAGKVIRPHKLRHHYATRLVRQGIPLFAIQKLLGHENIQSTQIYTHLDLSDVVKAANQDPMYTKEAEDV